MKKYINLFLLMAVLTFLLNSCTTKPATEDSTEPAKEITPIEKVEATPTEVEKVAEVVPVEVEKVMEVVPVEVEKADSEVVMNFKATYVNLKYNGEELALPKELANYPVYVETCNSGAITLKVPKVEFIINGNFEIQDDGILVTPNSYKNTPEIIIDYFKLLNVELPETFFFENSVGIDNFAYFKATAMDYKLITGWEAVK